MGSRVLICYGTAAGSTAETSERIARDVRAAGCEVASRPVGPDPDLSGVDALVLGSALHHMAWLPEDDKPSQDVKASALPDACCWSFPDRAEFDGRRLNDRERATVVCRIDITRVWRRAGPP
jgi:Flavodoxin domain